MSHKHLHALIAVGVGLLLASCHSNLDIDNVDPKAELEMGLALPQITRVFHGLRARGIDFPDEVYTVKYGAELLLKALAERGGRSC